MPATAEIEAPSIDVDPFSESFADDPYPFHERLRQAGPVVRLEKYCIYGMARHAQVHAALNDWQTFISGAGAGIQDLRTGKAWRPRSIVLEVDPPLHDETRAVLARVLSGPAIKKLRSDFEVEAERLVAELVSRGTFDAVDDLAMVYPLKVMGDAVGVPAHVIRKVLLSTISQPRNDRPVTAMAMCGSAISHSTAGIGRHCQSNRISARLASIT
jgi:cytochrome P450